MGIDSTAIQISNALLGPAAARSHSGCCMGSASPAHSAKSACRKTPSRWRYWFFNVGVEVGQLLFVAAFMVAALLLARARRVWPRWIELAPAYAIGSVAMFWVLQRVAALGES